MLFTTKLSLLLKLYSVISSAEYCDPAWSSTTMEYVPIERTQQTKSNSDHLISRILTDMACFKCGTPQERSFKSEELLKGNLSTSELAYPAWTSLHVCGNSTGFCQYGACGVYNSTNVQLCFQVIDNFSKNIRYLKYDAMNHTHCSCS